MLTGKERAVLRGIIGSEHQNCCPKDIDNLTEKERDAIVGVHVWSHCLTDKHGFLGDEWGRSFSGVVSSLVKKGFINRIDDKGVRGNSGVAITEEGMQAYEKSVKKS